jgi:hypothetical protein
VKPQSEAVLTTRTAWPAKARIGIGSPSIEVKAKSCAERGSADAIPAVAASHAIATISTRIITGLPPRGWSAGAARTGSSGPVTVV